MYRRRACLLRQQSTLLQNNLTRSKMDVEFWCIVRFVKGMIDKCDANVHITP